MTPSELVQLQINVERLQNNVMQLDRELRGMRIDYQTTVLKDKSLIPSTSSKVAFNSDGLIVAKYPLTPSDIPDLPISKIVGLHESLIQLENTNKAPIETRLVDASSTTGFKITYDEYGKVLSSSESLELNDLPDIPIEKVRGLSEALSSYLSYERQPPEPVIIKEVVTHAPITMENLPREFLNQINVMMTVIPTMASKESLEGIRHEVNNKVSKNTPIVPGEYSVVSVDSSGLVTKGSKLTIRDLPILRISDIHELDSRLANKANQSDLVNLINDVSAFMLSINNLDLGNLITTVASKADKSELDSLHFNTPPVAVDEPKLEQFVEELQLIKSRISAIDGILTVIQQKLNLIEV